MSCTDVETIQAGNGTKTQFSFDFPYIFKSEIHVYFWNVNTKEYDEVLTTDATYPWRITDANPTIVEFTGTAPPAPTAPVDPNELTVDNVKIRRITQIDAIRALFNPGSAIRSDDLNKNFEQLRYAIQESNCQGIPEGVFNFLRDYYWDNFDETVYSTDTWNSSDAKIASTSAIDSETETKFDTLVQTATPPGSNYRLGKTWLQNDDELTLSVWNGAAWTGVVSGGTFTNQPKVVYVDASSGDDNNDGHRISRPKLTIKAAVEQINADAAFGDGSVVVVAPGTYQETCPIDIQKANVSIVGTALRSCIIHPTVATENSVMFRVNSGTFLQSLTFTGMKAGSGTGNSLDPVLPAVQGWNVAFLPGCTITKSPYIQNCTNFSDSEIDNNNINVIFPAGGAAGDTDNAPTGGGLLVDGSVPAVSSPLRSMVCDSYTHVGLNGPGILVTNNGYAQCTSSYAFFNKYHIKCLNGGQANLAASTTDFGERALIADGKSPNAIFTSNVDGAANSGATSFNINEPAAGTGWFGDTNRPASNMLVIVNGVTYPILSATPNTDSEGGNGWTVTISRPDPSNRSVNLGLNGSISDNAAVQFFLRSQIASSGHTMEYVGSGMDYRALPENGGVPDETKQVVELNNGKIWTAITDHNGKFKIGGNQTDDPFFEVDQQRGFVTIPEGSIAFNLLSDITPQLGGDLDANGNDIILDTGTAADPSLTFTGDTNTGIYSPGANQVAVTTNGTGRLFVDASGDVKINDSASVTSNVDANLLIRRTSAASDTSIGIINSQNSDAGATVKIKAGQATRQGGEIVFGRDNAANWSTTSNADGYIAFSPVLNNVNQERLRINSSGNVGIGTTSPGALLHLSALGATDEPTLKISSENSNIFLRTAGSSGLFPTGGGGNDGELIYLGGDFRIGTGSASKNLIFFNGSSYTERMRIDSSGRLLVGTSTPRAVSTPTIPSSFEIETSSAFALSVINNINSISGPVIALGKTRGTSAGAVTSVISGDALGYIRFAGADGTDLTNSGAEIRAEVDGTPGANNMPGRLVFSTTASGASSPTERVRIDSSGNVGIGTAEPDFNCHIIGTGTDLLKIQRSGAGGGAKFRMINGDANYYDIFHDGSESLTISAGTTERMRIDSSGRLLVGTSSVLDVYGAQDPLVQILGTTTGNRGRLSIAYNNSETFGPGIHFNKSPGTLNNLVSDDDQLGALFFEGGDGSKQVRGAAIQAYVDGTPGADDMPGRLVFSTTADGSSTPTERVVIGQSGSTTFNATVASGDNYKIIDGARAILTSRRSSTSAVDHLVFNNPNGTVGVIDTTGTTTRYVTSSDYRLKENVTIVSDSIARLQQLKPCRFNFIADPDTTVDGFLAHEAAEVVPEATTGEKDAVDDDGNPVYQGIDQSKLVPLLTAALQEAIAKIETLEQRLTDAGL